MTATLPAPAAAAELPAGLVDAVLARLGLPGRPAVDPAGLARLYNAWCARVPYDNGRIRRSLADAPGRPVVGVGPAELLADNVATGNASQCTETAAALHALLRALGYDATLCLAYYNVATGTPLAANHVTVLVAFGPDRFLVDTVMLTGRPVPLREHEDRYGPLDYAVSRDPAGGWRLDSVTPVGRTPMVCRLLAAVADPEVCAEVYRAVQDEGFADFNAAFYARRAVGEEMVTFSSSPRGAFLHRTSPGGTRSVPVEGPEHRVALLTAELGLAEDFVRRLPPDTPPSR